MWFENQFPYFMWMALCGAGIMFFYDFLRISRRIKHIPNFIVNLEDLIFSAAAAVAVFYTTYTKNSGEIRWQTAGGLILGCALYMITVKDRFVKAVCVVWHAVVKILVKTIKIAAAPFIFVIKIILKPARIVFWYSGRGIKRAGAKAKIKGSKAKIRLKHMGYIMRKK